MAVGHETNYSTTWLTQTNAGRLLLATSCPSKGRKRTGDGLIAWHHNQRSEVEHNDTSLQISGLNSSKAHSPCRSHSSAAKVHPEILHVVSLVHPWAPGPPPLPPWTRTPPPPPPSWYCFYSLQSVYKPHLVSVVCSLSINLILFL